MSVLVGHPAAVLCVELIPIIAAKWRIDVHATILVILPNGIATTLVHSVDREVNLELPVAENALSSRCDLHLRILYHQFGKSPFHL